MDKLTTQQIAELMGDCNNGIIFDGLIKTNEIINKPEYRNVVCSISGGSDSDIMMDILSKLDINHKIKYVWFDTGLEYQATKDHLQYLQDKYGVEIQREKVILPIPYVAKHMGQPFLSKLVSEHISRLQRHGFKWEDEDFTTLANRYCKKANEKKSNELERRYANGQSTGRWVLIDGAWYTGCISSLRWWCNTKLGKSGTPSRFDIANNTYLKEFMILNPPTFKISPLCCRYAKKDVAKKYNEDHNIDLSIIGIRKYEGGARATAYKTCYSVNDNGIDYHRPIFFYLNETKRDYEDYFHITHSKCYTEYGLTRTGCVGCPFNRKITDEIDIISKSEPKLYKAVSTIFADSYEYTKQYREFQKMMKLKKKAERKNSKNEEIE